MCTVHIVIILYVHDWRTKRFIRRTGPSGEKNEYLSRPTQFLATENIGTDLLDVNAAVFIFHFHIINVVVVIIKGWF